MSETKIKPCPFCEWQYSGMSKLFRCGCQFRDRIKTSPLDKENGKGNIVYIGIAADEPHRAMRLSNNPQRANGFRFPLIEWEIPEWKCLEYLKEKGLHNPLYDIYNRLGCWQCQKQSKRSLYCTFKHFPELWQKLLKYQEDSPTKIHPKKSVFDYDKEFRHALATECAMEALLSGINSERERPCACQHGE